ncbi:MAG: hypothetical protein LGR52_10805 [Candidatus Thiosymbion ectosymbiont of Robbea hypermnestra]|nr:hypothetical protein [Candidatus Thiosymbion ectosymbiont of Robbea hypermnestra]
MERPLRIQEQTLLRKMLSGGERQVLEFLKELDSVRVEEMDDNGMGSLRFISESQRDRRPGETIAEAEFLDEDGVTVSAVINVDQQGKLYELDLWKVDFSPLKNWPKAEQITVKDALYRPDAKIGSGSPPDAIRHELRTDNLLSPKDPFQKGIEVIFTNKEPDSPMVHVRIRGDRR